MLLHDEAGLELADLKRTGGLPAVEQVSHLHFVLSSKHFGDSFQGLGLDGGLSQHPVGQRAKRAMLA